MGKDQAQADPRRRIPIRPRPLLRLGPRRRPVDSRRVRPRSEPQKSELLLEVHDLVKSFKKRRVVDRVSFQVRAGEIVGLLGANGAGKTTSFRMTVGLTKPDSGEVRLRGRECARLAMFQRARLGMGYLPQERSVFQRLSVRDNLLAVLEAMPYSRAERRA